MDRTTIMRTGIAGAVAALGLSVGGVAMVNADTLTASSTTTAAAEPGARPDGGQLATTLAKQLGLDESVVKRALDSVRDDLKTDKPSTTDGAPTPPTVAERTARQAAFVKALAAELDVSEAKVKAALAVAQKEADANRAEMRTKERAALVTRLAAAVQAGTLTAADETSVLKAFDAKLVGGGFGDPGSHGGGPGGPPPAA